MELKKFVHYTPREVHRPDTPVEISSVYEAQVVQESESEGEWVQGHPTSDTGVETLDEEFPESVAQKQQQKQEEVVKGQSCTTHELVTEALTLRFFEVYDTHGTGQIDSTNFHHICQTVCANLPTRSTKRLFSSIKSPGHQFFDEYDLQNFFEQDHEGWMDDFKQLLIVELTRSNQLENLRLFGQQPNVHDLAARQFFEEYDCDFQPVHHLLQTPLDDSYLESSILEHTESESSMSYLTDEELDEVTFLEASSVVQIHERSERTVEPTSNEV